jgi:hypothetical protein
MILFKKKFFGFGKNSCITTKSPKTKPKGGRKTIIIWGLGIVPKETN